MSEYTMIDRQDGVLRYGGVSHEERFLVDTIGIQMYRLANTTAALEEATDKLTIATITLRKTIIEQTLDWNLDIVEEIYL